MSFKRRVLSALKKDQLLEVGRGLELHVTARMPVQELRDTLARSKRARLEAIVTVSLPRDTLKEICSAVGLDETGAEKAALVERILAAAAPASEPSDASEASDEPGSEPSGEPGRYTIDPARGKASRAAEGVATIGLLPGFELPPAGKPSPAKAKTETNGEPKAKARSKKETRRRGGVAESQAVVSGTLKAALQQFALSAAGGYQGRNAALSFTTHLLECFGWNESSNEGSNKGRPEGAELQKRLAIVEAGQRAEREVALWWPERRTLMEVAAHDAVLEFAWKDLVRVCLQLAPIPQYVVLTNQRDLQLYDLARDREAPRLAIRIDDLPKYSEAFPFFTKEWTPGAVPKIVNVEKVSEEVADLVARLYRSVRAQHPSREKDVIRFTLQCITAMFAEDIGLLPKNYFTSLLYHGAKSGDIERRLHELFTQMNTPELPAPRVVPYFNGGLFTEAATLPLGDGQVQALTKASEANWSYVDPHIFGSVFQGIMDDAERHASGAHYTAHDDIMRVVGPTIVEPWRKRIAAAASLKELTELRKELFAYRVLDPACGSGNFLYVAFRELYRLDTELLSRLREFASTASKLSWNGGISAANFYGIDINPFAVELAKVTLNIAKKIAFEERKAQAFALAGQVEMDMDPSLPLDNLDQNIVCADALFTDWPEVEAIVGNPPFLGGQKIRKELGVEYMDRLAAKTGLDGTADIACYFFRKAHDLLPTGGRAGLVATSGIRVGKAKTVALDYIVKNNGTITNAVSSKLWPGEAAVNVSMVNWTKGPADGPFALIVDEQVLSIPRIPTHLQLFADLTEARELGANQHGCSMGPIFGHAAYRSGPDTFDPTTFISERSIRPVATANSLLRGQLEGVCVWLADCDTEDEARAVGPRSLEFLKERVYSMIKARVDSGTATNHYKHWIRTWWRAQMPRLEMFAELKGKRRFISCAANAARPVFVFLSTTFIPTNTLYVFTFEDDYSFGVLQSAHHWRWAIGKGTRTREDISYGSGVWGTFPWPQDPTDEQVAAVAEAGRALRRTRDTLMAENGWSLRQLYQAAEVEGPHPLKEAQAALDAAVAEAYGIPPDQGPVEFLLELNQLVAEDEAQGHKVRGPGLPDHLDPKDARWMSTDCIEPPPVAS